MSDASGFTGWLGRNTKLAIGLAVAAVLIIVALIVAQYTISVQNEGERMQERIETLYKSSQNSLSTCIDQGQVGAQVAAKERATMRDAAVDIVSARYENEDGSPTNATEALGGGRFISMLQENNPTIDPALFKNLQATVIGCRTQFQGAQDRLFIDAQAFKQWQLSNNVFNSGIKAGFPSEELDVENLKSGETMTGVAALTYMTRVITVEAAKDAFESGTLGEQDLFGSKAESKE